ncbi:hypothetical protein FHR92_005042 [Fontibacillus solani]|uniref:Uncharacterized protein n=1 Tax=Fontibacillus solani TaxID=1572857 RepID=A0A7W3SYJ9_9BACL|nr:hypothetical protein [Fontibacillus solani]MBA9088525.1 hypothetical protein [Fontibacillus solani]
MKVFRKKVRSINVKGMLFFCVVDERKHDVVFRVYSGKFRSSYVEILFDWKDTYWINLYKPSVRAKLIEYIIDKGWKPDNDKQISRILDSNKLIEELSLKEI